MIARVQVTRFLAVTLALCGGVGPQLLAAQTAASEYRISGTVVDGLDGHPLSRAMVTVSPATGMGAPRSVMTNEGGKFVFEHIVAGKYRLSARRRGYAPQQYKQHEEFSTAIVSGPKLDSGHIRFALLPGATIAGVVTDEANEGVRNATVRLFRKDLQAGRSAMRMQDQTTSDDEGRYRFARLESGVYFIGVEAHPWYAENDNPSLGGSGVVDGLGADRFSRARGVAAEDPALDVIYEDTYFSNANRVEEASPLRVGPGDHAIADLALHPIPALHLLVHTGGSGNAVFVHAESGSYARGGLHKAVSGESGVAEFGGLKPGLVTVFLDPAEERGKIQTRSLVLSGDADVDSEVFSDGVTISGVVKMNDHSALPARVSLGLRRLENPQAPPVANVGDNGEFDFGRWGLTKGVYDIFAFEPAGAAVVSLSANGASVAGQELIISAEKEVRLTVTIAIGAARAGGVAEKEGQPLEGAMMLLVPLDFGGDASLYRRDQSDSDGTFGFENVVPGNYVAVGIEDGWGLEWSQPEVIQKYLARGTKVMVGRDGVANLKVVVQ